MIHAQKKHWLILMCFSTESSLIAWVISVVIAIYLWKRNRNYDRWNSAFILSFSTVQLCEAGLWNQNPPSSTPRTHIWLSILLVALYSQPLVQTFCAWRHSGDQILKIMTLIYTIILVIMLYRTMTENFYTTVGPNGHLVWNSRRRPFLTGGCYLIGILYLIGVFLGLLWVVPQSMPLIAIGFFTLVWSMSQAPGGEFGSFWCFTAVAYSVAAIFVE